MGLVVYMDHPIGESDTSADMQQRADNLANASDWIRFFVDTTAWTLMCPWWVWAVSHGGLQHYGRRLVDSYAALERSDVLVHVGGVLAPHTKLLTRKAKRIGLPVCDLTGLGIAPPDPSDHDTVQVILARIKRSMLAVPRRIWMPLLTPEDIEHLRRARHALYAYYPEEQEHQDEVLLLDRIIDAATDYGAT